MMESGEFGAFHSSAASRTATLVFCSLAAVLQLSEPAIAGGLNDIILRNNFYTPMVLLQQLAAMKGVCLVLGIACLLFGEAMYRFIICIPTALLGAALLGAAGYAWWHEVGAVIGGLLGLSIGASLAWALHQIAVFLVGCYWGALLSSGVWAALFHSTPNPFLVFFLAIVAGMFTLWLSMAFIYVISSMIGAFLIMLGTGKTNNILMFIGITLLGCAIQFGWLKYKGETSHSSDDSRGATASGAAALGALFGWIKGLLTPKPQVDNEAVALIDLHYSGGWRRFAAMVLDGLIFGAPVVIITILAQMVSFQFARIVQFFTSICLLLVYAWFESSPLQATPGKIIMGVRVSDCTGSRVPFGKAMGRNFAKIISGIPLFIGFLIAFFTVRKQALHDKMAGTLVIHDQRDPGNQQYRGRVVLASVCLGIISLPAGIFSNAKFMEAKSTGADRLRFGSTVDRVLPEPPRVPTSVPAPTPVKTPGAQASSPTPLPQSGGMTLDQLKDKNPSSSQVMGNSANDCIESSVRKFYQAVQDKRVDDAVNMFCSSKRPGVKVHLISAVAKDTEYYVIDSINVNSIDAQNADTIVKLRHKKFKRPEERWEINVKLLNESGDWKIVATPGRKI
jgi:uncharacterized RDD family membrane protein YckC